VKRSLALFLSVGIYIAAMTLWMVTVFDDPEGNLGNLLIPRLILHLAVGSIVGLWWAVLLPIFPSVIAALIGVVGSAERDYHVITGIGGAAAISVGVASRKLIAGMWEGARGRANRARDAA
jgi:hypothetical protein